MNDEVPRHADVSSLRDRETRAIFGGVALGTTALFAAFTLGPLVSDEITGSDALSGLPGASSVIGVAAGAAFLSAVMARRGRREGLQLGYFLGTVGGVGAAFAIELSAFVPLLVAMVLIGVSHAGNQLARFAAADMHSPERRGTVLSWIVWASTIGAVAGPNLLRPMQPIARALGLPRSSGGFVLAAVLCACALVGSTVWLRPDPRVIAGEDTSGAGVDRTKVFEMWSLPRVQVALAAMVTSQITMLAIMTVTPLHIRHAGQSLTTVGIVMSSHFVGMFGLAPVAGKFVDRLGSIRVILFGLALLNIGAVMAAVLPASTGAAFSLPLVVLGLGWSCSFVAGSALLAGGLSYSERARLQGSVDALVWSFSAVASLGAGLVVAGPGFAALCIGGAALMVLPMTLVARRRRAPAI